MGKAAQGGRRAGLPAWGRHEHLKAADPGQPGRGLGAPTPGPGPAPTHWQSEGTSVKTRSRNSPVWPGSKVVGMMTKRPSGWSVRRKTLRELM